MTEGILQDGWEYVWASYFLTWGTLALYSFSIWMRNRKSAQELKEMGLDESQIEEAEL